MPIGIIFKNPPQVSLVGSKDSVDRASVLCRRMMLDIYGYIRWPTVAFHLAAKPAARATFGGNI